LAFLYSESKKGLWRFYRKGWVNYVLYGVLFLNIAEATLKDFQTFNYFNALCGVILCATIPLPYYRKGKHQYWSVAKRHPHEVLFFSTAAWNVLYTTWNMCFVYGESPAFFFSSFCILVAAEAYPLIKGRPELYIHARIYTLAFHVLARGIHDIFTPYMNSEPFHSDTVLMWWGILNLVLHVPFVIWYFRQRIANGEAPYGPNPPPLHE